MRPRTLILQRKTVQLNMYKDMLEEGGRKIDKMFTVCFHESESEAKKMDIDSIRFPITST